MADKKRVVITTPLGGDRYDTIFQPDTMAQLKEVADVVDNDLDRGFTTEELAERARDCDAIITSWGSPRIDQRIIDACPKVKIISHAAGTVKYFISEEIWDAGITVTSSAPAMAVYVGEFALCLTLALLRTLPRYGFGAHKDKWQGTPMSGNLTLHRKTVGIIALSQTGRQYLKLLEPFNCNVVVYDPYCSREQAAELGVKLVSLDELLSTSDVISMHAPITEETKGMLNKGNLKLIRDGAVFVNTARGITVNLDDLTEELKTGRFSAGLDVTDPTEPLPEDHPLRHMPNVVVTPHIAGPTIDGRRDMFQYVVDDLKLFWEGKSPRYVITKRMLQTMA